MGMRDLGTPLIRLMGREHPYLTGDQKTQCVDGVPDRANVGDDGDALPLREARNAYAPPNSLLIGASGLCGGTKSSAPTVRCTPDVANASSLRVIAASIAALMRSDPPSAAFSCSGRYAG